MNANDKEMVKFWKANLAPFAMAPVEAQTWFKRFDGPKEQFCTGAWFSVHTPGPDFAARISPDYQPAKAGKLVECDVTGLLEYEFTGPNGGVWPLHEAPGMVGFSGVLYPGAGWRYAVEAVFKTNEDASLGRPIAPTKVRFWVEG